MGNIAHPTPRLATGAGRDYLSAKTQTERDRHADRHPPDRTGARRASPRNGRLPGLFPAPPRRARLRLPHLSCRGDGVSGQSVHDCDGWLITGSRHGVYEDHPFIKPLEQFVRTSIAGKVPMVGVCFGHQLIAQAMGGKVERYDGGWAVGPTDYDFNGSKVTMNAWHRDQVTEVPEGATVCASNEFCEKRGPCLRRPGLYGSGPSRIQGRLHRRAPSDPRAGARAPRRDGGGRRQTWARQ